MEYYIIIRGPLGCGKSTISKALAKRLKAEHFAVDRIFRGGPPSACPEEADVNGDTGILNILDLTFLVDRIFRGGPPPGGC